MKNAKRYASELIGTFILVFFGAGSAVVALKTGGVIVVALAFGLTLLALVYVRAGLRLSREPRGDPRRPADRPDLTARRGLPPGRPVPRRHRRRCPAAPADRLGGVPDETGSLGANTYGKTIDLGGTFVVEIVLTFLFVLVVLAVTSRSEQVGITGLAIGLALGACHLVRSTSTAPPSTRPARSARPSSPAVHRCRRSGSSSSPHCVGGALAALASPVVLRKARHGRSKAEPINPRLNAQSDGTWQRVTPALSQG